MRALSLACIAATLALPHAARGDGAGVIAAAGADRAAVAGAVAEAMAGRATRIVPDAVGEARATLAAGAVPSEALARFRAVRDQVDEGWRAYLRVAVENAQLRLANARTEAEPLLALPGGAEVYADAALRLGAVLGHLGRKAEAQAVLALALALDPDRPITLAEFSPDVVDAVEAARRTPAPIRRLRVTAEPAGTLIRIDGADVGRAPVDVEVTRGQHVVIARAPQHRAAVRGIAIEDAPAALALELEPDEDALRLAAGAQRGLGESSAQQLIDATLRYADLDEVAVVADTSRRGGPALLLQRCAGLPARCSAAVELGYADRAGLAAAARAAWEAARAGELRYPPSVLGDLGERTVDGGRRRWYRSKLLWAGVGAAVIGGLAVGIAIATAASQPPTVLVDTGGFTK